MYVDGCENRVLKVDAVGGCVGGGAEKRKKVNETMTPGMATFRTGNWFLCVCIHAYICIQAYICTHACMSVYRSDA
jgi:hypothetical protein